MAHKIEMPKLSDTMEEGVIVKWNVQEGDRVEAGDIIAEVETDKATMEVEAFDPGTVLKIVAKEGDAVPLGGIIVVIGEEGENIDGLLGDGADSGGAGGASTGSGGSGNAVDVAGASVAGGADVAGGGTGVAGGAEEFDPILGDLQGGAGAQASTRGTTASAAGATNGVSGATGMGGAAMGGGGNGAAATAGALATAAASGARVKASPLARSMARERGIDLATVRGSGPDGRIVKADIESARAGAPAPQVAQPVQRATEDIRVSQMRKVIAKRLSESKFTNPHFYETVDIDMEHATSTRAQLNEISDVKISFNDMIVKACATALRKHPYVNSSWLGDTIRMHGDVHIAVAVAVPDGLMTPVIRNADQKPLSQLSKETRELAGLARDKRLQPDQMEGSTFTISNLGMFGIEEFTAIINPPNAAILAVGAIRDVPVVKNGQVVPGKRMKVTLSSDHRIVDGAKAAEFLSTLRNLLQNPLLMFLSEGV